MADTTLQDLERRLAEQYGAALEDYLAGAGEAALMRAYELGRGAIADGLGILKVAATYHETLATLMLRLTPEAEESADIARRAAAFLSESLSPFEMAYRGFEEAITSLRRLNETLEQRVAERTQELRRLERLNQNIVATVPAGLLVLDKGRSVVSANRGFVGLTHLRASEVVGKPVGTVLDALEVPEPCRDAIVAGEPVRGLDCRGCAPVAEGAAERQVLFLCLSLTPLQGEGSGQGEEDRQLLVVEDVTARKQAEQETEAARQRLLEAEIDKKRFYREVILAVTNGKFHLADTPEIPVPGQPTLDISLEDRTGYATARKELQEKAVAAGMAPDAAGDLVLAAGEAITNAVKHAVQGRCLVYESPGRLVVRVSDRGRGIRPDDLPGAVLRPGFSTKVSLGMGYTLMLTLTDELWLATSQQGTVVQLEKWVHPEEHAPLTATEAWSRL